MTGVINSIDQVLAVQSFVSALGWVFAAAMIVGAILDDDYRNIVRWVFAGVIYVIFQEIVRAVLISSIAPISHPTLGFTVSFFVLITYTVGLISGWVLVYVAKKRTRTQLAKKESDAKINDTGMDLQEKNAQT